jgi:hypothetical protein
MGVVSHVPPQRLVARSRSVTEYRIRCAASIGLAADFDGIHGIRDLVERPVIDAGYNVADKVVDVFDVFHLEWRFISTGDHPHPPLE